MPKLCHCRKIAKEGRVFVLKEGEKPKPQFLCEEHRNLLLRASSKSGEHRLNTAELAAGLTVHNERILSQTVHNERSLKTGTK